MHPSEYIEFDGNNRSGIELGSPTELGIVGESFSIDLWFSADDVSSQYALVASAGESHAKSTNLHLLIRNRKPYMGFYGEDTAGKTEIKTGQWYHLAFVYNKDKKQQTIYLNGEEEATKSNRSPYKGKNNILLGAWPDQNSVFRGKIGRLRFWQEALSQEKVRVVKDMEIHQSPSLRFLWKGNGEEELQRIAGDGEFVRYAAKRKEQAEDKALLDQTWGGTGVEMTEFIENARRSITKARENARGTGFNLGTVHLDFKVIPQGTGNSVIFPTPEQMEKTGTNLSTLRIDFEPPKPIAEAQVPKVKVPDVTEMTEIMARRQLTNAGLITKVKYQTTEEQKEVNRVVMQTPRPTRAEDNANYNIGSTVVIYIGKEILKPTKKD